MGAPLQRAARIRAGQNGSGGGAQQHPPPARLKDGEGGAVRGTGRRRPLRAGARPGLRSQSRPRPSTAGRPRCPAIWKATEAGRQQRAPMLAGKVGP